MNEDALARTKFQEIVVGRNTDNNPGRYRRSSSRNERLIIALEQYRQDHIKEFMFGLREDV